jgi:CHAD domain-containing protein
MITEENKLEESAGKYINSLFNIINENSNNISQISFHDIRKLMKELGYNYSLLSEAFYYLTDEILISDINNLNKILGKWHDKSDFEKIYHKNKEV